MLGIMARDRDTTGCGDTQGHPAHPCPLPMDTEHRGASLPVQMAAVSCWKMPQPVRRDRAAAVPGLIPPCTAKPEPGGFSVRFVPRPTHAPGRFCGGGDLAGGALGVSPAHTVPAAHESGRKSLWSKRDRFIFFLQKGSWKKTAPKTAPKRPGTATRKPRRLEAGTWHVVFGLISRETSAVRLPRAPQPRAVGQRAPRSPGGPPLAPRGSRRDGVGGPVQLPGDGEGRAALPERGHAEDPQHGRRPELVQGRAVRLRGLRPQKLHQDQAPPVVRGQDLPAPGGGAAPQAQVPGRLPHPRERERPGGVLRLRQLRAARPAFQGAPGAQRQVFPLGGEVQLPQRAGGLLQDHHHRQEAADLPPGRRPEPRGEETQIRASPVRLLGPQQLPAALLPRGHHRGAGLPRPQLVAGEDLRARRPLPPQLRPPPAQVSCPKAPLCTVHVAPPCPHVVPTPSPCRVDCRSRRGSTEAVPGWRPGWPSFHPEAAQLPVPKNNPAGGSVGPKKKSF